MMTREMFLCTIDKEDGVVTFSLAPVDLCKLRALAKVLHGMADKYNEKGWYDLGTTFAAIAEQISEALGVDDR